MADGTFKIPPDKYIAILKLIDDFCIRGKVQEPPEFLVISGGTGVGKTTIRRQKYSDGWVVVDPGDLYHAGKKTVGEDSVELPWIYFSGIELVKRAIAERRNILIEVIGDKFEPLNNLLDKMKAIGYTVRVEFIFNDIAKSWENNLKRGKDNTSSFYTQDETYAWFNSALK